MEQSTSLGLYKSVPTRISHTNRDKLGMEVLEGHPNKFIESFLSSRVDSRKMKAGLLSQLKVQTMLLDQPYKASKVVNLQRPPKRLSAKDKRQLKIYDIPKLNQKYELFLPLHELWLKYMEDLLQLQESSDGNRSINQAQMNHKVMKADYHGSIIKVIRSKCPSYIGVEGILVQETQNTLKIICADNCLRTIPKAHSVFSLTVHKHCFHLYGNHMKFRSSERSARKFKEKPTIEL